MAGSPNEGPEGTGRSVVTKSLGDRVFESQRQGRSESTSNGVDATRIVPGLWMGSRPPTGRAVSEAGFDLLVLCAEEYQPPAWMFPGVEVIHAPFDDNDIGPTSEEQATARSAARQVVSATRKGRKVLVTCFAGRNRSGLVTGLALLAQAHPPLRVVDLIQRRRTHALTNRFFVDLLTGPR